MSDTDILVWVVWVLLSNPLVATWCSIAIAVWMGLPHLRQLKEDSKRYSESAIQDKAIRLLDGMIEHRMDMEELRYLTMNHCSTPIHVMRKVMTSKYKLSCIYIPLLGEGESDFNPLVAMTMEDMLKMSGDERIRLLTDAITSMDRVIYLGSQALNQLNRGIDS
jgi:hypothetical protein